MNTDKLSQLKALWQQAFGDSDAFTDRFFARFYAPERCRFLEEDGKILSALYWFDCYLDGSKWAYLYAVATEKAHRGRGLCRRLMETTHRDLAAAGYAGAVLVPAEEHLWDYYKKLGYAPFGGIRSFTAGAGTEKAEVEAITPEVYRQLRAAFAPKNALDQFPAYSFFEGWGGFYRGDGWLLAGGLDGESFLAQEFFGSEAALPGILRALGAKEGSFRVPGGDTPCGMYLKFSPRALSPGYLGFALD